MRPFYIKLPADVAGNSKDIIGYKLGKGKPSVYIQGGIHAGEITYWIFKHLFKKFNNNKLNGSVTLIPIANPFNWNTKSYFYTAGKFWDYDGTDWNRYFPGNPKGLLPSILADKLFQEAKQHDLIIDLHTSRKSLPYGIYVSEKDKQYIKLLGFKYNQFIDGEKPEKAGTLNHACNNVGIRSVALECGSHDSYEGNNIKNCVDKITNLLIGLNIIKGKLNQRKKILTFEKHKTYIANASGFVKFICPLGKNYKKGETLYQLSPSDNLAKKVNVTAEEDGVVFKYSPTHIYHFGQPVMQIIKKSDLK